MATINVYTYSSGIDLKSDDNLYVYNGGLVPHVTMPANARMYVSGGRVNIVTAEGCYKSLIDIKSGEIGTASVEHSVSASVRVSGGVISNADLFEGAIAVVSSGGTIGSALLKDGGELTLNYGGSVTSSVVSQGGIFKVFGTISRTSVYAGGRAEVWNNGKFQSAAVYSGGSVNVNNGGSAVSSWILSSGLLTVSSNGLANGVTVSSGGSLNVSNGGRALYTVLSGIGDVPAEMNIFRGGRADFTSAKFSANINLWGSASHSFLNAGGMLRVSSGGVAVDTLVNEHGTLCVCENGSALTATVSGFQAALKVSSGGTASSAILLGSGREIVFDGGRTVSTIVRDKGTLSVSSGGTAKDTLVSSAGALNVFADGFASGGSILSGGIGCVFQGGVACSMTLDSGAMDVFVGGTAAYMDVSGTGALNVLGHAENTLVRGGSMMLKSKGESVSASLVTGLIKVEEGGSVSRTFMSGGVMRVGGMVYETTIYGGHMRLNRPSDQSPKVIARDTVLYGGSAAVCSGCVMSNTSAYGGILHASAGGFALQATLAGSGSLFVHTDGFASVCTVSSGGSATVYGTMSILHAETGGSVYVRENGTVSNITLHGGSIHVFDGGMLAGNLFLYDGTVQMDNGSIISVDISQMSEASLASQISHWKLISGTPDCRITVSATQALGNYAIAGDAADFSGSFTVKDTSGVSVGTVSVGESLLYEGQYYKLRKVAKKLLLTVSDTLLERPEVLSVDANITTPTKYNVIVTANFSETSDVQEYSFDKKEWMSYNSYVEMTQNGTVYFRGSNESETSAIASYTVSNIDKTPPEVPVVTVSTEAPTEGPILLTVKYSEDSVQKLYSSDGENWLSYSKPITVSANGSWFFRGIDEAGNFSDATRIVTNIAKIGVPTAPVPSADITAPTNQDVTVTAKFSADSVKKEYSLDGKTWLEYTGGIKFKTNGTVRFRGTNSGGKSSSVISYKVSNIDKTPPEAPKVSADITSATNKNVTVSASFSADSAVKQYSRDGKAWKTYSGPVVFSSNGKVWFRGIDKVGNISSAASYMVGNIDKTDYEIKGDILVSDTQQIKLNYSGKYTLNGTFGSDVNGTVTVFNGGKKAGSGTIRDGVLDFNPGKEMLLDKSLETVAVITIKNGTSTAYTMQLVPIKLFTKSDNSNDSPENSENLGVLSSAGTFISSGWVGTGDSTDFYEFTLKSAARLSLRYTSTDAVRFTLCNSLMKPLLKTSLKANAEVLSKPKLVEAGVYYLSVLSTNAKKGGSADYTAAIDEQTAFFTKGDTSDDTPDSAKNIGTLSSSGKVASDWVGYGDVIDYKKFSLASSAKLNFTLTSSDSVKFTVWQDSGRGLKAVLKASLKGGSINTKDVLVTEGVCYFSVQSSNAKKGGSADYTVTVNENSEFFPKGDHTNDSVGAAFDKKAKEPEEKISGWVGFGDPADYIRFRQAQDGLIQLKLDGATAEAYAAKRVKIKCLDASGKSVSFVSDGDTLTAKKETLKGDCCLGVLCSNVKKFNTSYGVTTGVIASVL